VRCVVVYFLKKSKVLKYALFFVRNVTGGAQQMQPGDLFFTARPSNPNRITHGTLPQILC